MLSSNKARSLAAGALAFVSFASPSLGAGLPSKKGPASAPPAFTWTGLYIGLNFGHTWTGSNPLGVTSANLYDAPATGFGAASALGASGVTSGRLDGFLSGGQAGYNWQFSEKFVAGLEADLQGAGVRGGGGFVNGVSPVPGAFAVTSAALGRNLEYLGTVRGRLGYAVMPNLLVYATGGLAYGGANQTIALQQTLVPSVLFSRGLKGAQFDNLAGWTIGAGAEMALSRQLSAKLEYLYYDLGNLTLTNARLAPLAFRDLGAGGIPLANATNVSTRFNGHVLRAGLNYRFDWSIPESSSSSASPLLASPNVALAAPASFGDWRLWLTPYAWALGMNGSMTARGQTFGADASFIDAFTQTSSIPLTAAARVEARNGPLSIFADYAWFRLRYAGSTLVLRSPAADLVFAANAALRLKETMAIGEAAVAYEVARVKFGGSEATTAIDAYAGLRYNYVGIDLSLDAFGAANSQLLGLEAVGAKAIAKSGGIRWVDPLVGLRLRRQFSPSEEFQMRGDIGGFGAGSKFSWQFYGGYNRDFEFNGMKLTSSVGYRVLSIDYVEGWGNQKRGLDAILHGPVSGISLRF